MIQYDFDLPYERRGTDSEKWKAFGNEVLPLWVADMDFPAPPAVLQALHERVAHGIFGYGGVTAELSEAICHRLWEYYHWAVTPDQLLFLPGLVSGLNISCRAVCPPGAGVLVQTPIYPPFLSAPVNQGLHLNIAELFVTRSKQWLHYSIDYNAFEAAIQSHTRLFMLCNPHNPVGRCYTREELINLAEICTRNDLIICADEIHCDLLLENSSHLPIASLSPEIAKRCITLMAPSKTFNIAGLYCGFAIIQNPSLRKQYQLAAQGIMPEVNLLGFTAALAAYKNGETWHKELMVYLNGNRNVFTDYVQEHLPMLRTTIPEGTFLAWLDCSATGIIGNQHEFFLNHAKVALNDGQRFGQGGNDFVRLNFGCSRSTLTQALMQMKFALATLN
jgi:cystathionine beta-lyase